MNNSDENIVYLNDAEPMDTVEQTLSENPYEIASDRVKELVDVLGPRKDLPPGFLDDPFVLGFLFWCAHAHFAASGMEDDDYSVVPEIFDGAFGDEGPAISARAAKLREDGEPSFLLGVENGKKYFSTLDGSDEYESDSVVAQALSRADEVIAQETDEYSCKAANALFVALYEALFLDVLRVRYS